MRKVIIAGLMSVSCASTTWSQTSQPLWFSLETKSASTDKSLWFDTDELNPQSATTPIPAAPTTKPLSPSKTKDCDSEVSFAARFGGLLGKPKPTQVEPGAAAAPPAMTEVVSKPAPAEAKSLPFAEWSLSPGQPFSFDALPAELVPPGRHVAAAAKSSQVVTSAGQSFASIPWQSPVRVANVSQEDLIEQPTQQVVPPTPTVFAAPVHTQLVESLIDYSFGDGSAGNIVAEPVHYVLADEGAEQAKSASDKSEVLAQGMAKSPERPLLYTESMIGPLKGADSLFGRLELQDDIRDYASTIYTGPRGDANGFEWMPAAYTWISPAFYHKPLYFEQPNLERYGVGHARVAQPLLSSIHFFGSIPLVPYKTLTHHPREKVYTLGQGRPGNCVPVQRKVLLGQSTVGEVLLFWEDCSGYY